jgi:hypothetical protein
MLHPERITRREMKFDSLPPAIPDAEDNSRQTPSSETNRTRSRRLAQLLCRPKLLGNRVLGFMHAAHEAHNQARSTLF